MDNPTNDLVLDDEDVVEVHHLVQSSHRGTLYLPIAKPYPGHLPTYQHYHIAATHSLTDTRPTVVYN